MKLKKKEKYNLGFIFLATYLSGVALFIFGRWIRVPTPVGEQHHPVEQWVRIAHTTSALVILLGLGYMIHAHVMPGLKQKKRQVSGISMLSIFGILCVTALGVLYSGESDWNGFMSQSHDWIGLGTPALLLFHSWSRRRSKV